MKYARWEVERRFLLASVPAIGQAGPTAQLHDRYLRDTRLRLRRVVRPGEPTVYKLGQKIPGLLGPDGWPPAVAHTSLYLDEAEYTLLAQLPAEELTKTRTLFGDGPTLAVDVFADRLAGLVLAEYELDTADEPDLSELPVLAEVTDDPRFSGGALARTSAADLTQLLANYH
jgi:hypothetical protein